MSVYEGEGPPRLSWDMWKRFALGGILVVSLSATAVAVSATMRTPPTAKRFHMSQLSRGGPSPS